MANWFGVKIEVEELIQHLPQHSQGPGRETSRTPGLCSSDSGAPKGQGLEKRNPFFWGRGGHQEKNQYFENIEEINLSFTPVANSAATVAIVASSPSPGSVGGLSGGYRHLLPLAEQEQPDTKRTGCCAALSKGSLLGTFPSKLGAP